MSTSAGRPRARAGCDDHVVENRRCTPLSMVCKSIYRDSSGTPRPPTLLLGFAAEGWAVYHSGDVGLHVKIPSIMVTLIGRLSDVWDSQLVLVSNLSGGTLCHRDSV